MFFENEAALQEFKFWCAQISAEKPPPSSYVSLNAIDILRAHFALVDHFESSGTALGGVGPRSIDLLESTVSRQYTGFGNDIKWTNQYEIIATLFFGLIRNHPFFDANKRTALICCILHLELCGKCLMIDDQELEDFTVSTADRKLHLYRKKQHRSKALRQGDEEIRFISRWIRRNSRNIDREFREVSYEKLRTILNHYGFDLIDPKNNQISLVRIQPRRPGFMSTLFPSLRSNQRLKRVGFHSWKTTVPRGLMKEIRDVTGLNWSNGIDSSAFYRIEDPIQYLIGRYEVPLRNLADR